MMCSREWVIG